MSQSYILYREAQLYNLEVDPSETTNLYKEKPEIAQKLLKDLEYDIAHGSTRNGVNTKNDVRDIVLWKSSRGDAKALEKSISKEKKK